MGKLAGDTAWYTLGNLIPKISNFLLLPLYSAFLSPEDYGIISAMLTGQMVLLPICTLALDRGLERLFFDSDDPQVRRTVVGTLNILMLGWAALVLAAGFLWRDRLRMVFPNIPFFPYYAIMLGVLGLDMLTITPKVYWRVTRQVKRFVFVSFAQFAVLLAMKLVFIVALRRGAAGFMIANLLAAVLLTPFFAWESFRLSTFRIDFRRIREALLFSIPMVPLLLSGWIINLTSRMFIDRNANMTALGIYSFAMTLASAFQLIGVSFLPAYGPVFYEIANSGDRSSAGKLFEYNRGYMLFIMFLGFCQALFMRDVLLCLNQRYLECWKYIPVMTLGIFFNLLGGVYNLCFYQAKKSALVMILFFASAALNIFLTWLLIAPWGVWGCVWAGALSSAVLFAVTYLFAHRYFFVPLDLGMLGALGGIAVAINAGFYFLELKLAADFFGKLVCCTVIAAALLRWKGEIFSMFLPAAVTRSAAWKRIYEIVTYVPRKKAI
ncbi:MAG: oligosaccharide flippase family protein [Lentisphaeria bacterium]|nr:oligosaccharide flippase family protein [Lentisphaeria bacterium]